jgi:Amt family ammonium transporter
LFELEKSVDVFYLLWAAVLVFSMQTGFCFLECGMVRKKNTKSILLKNILDCCVGGIAYYLFGFAFAYGETSNGFIGNGFYALTPETSFLEQYSYVDWFFQYAFAATATSIVSGAIAERCTMEGYFVYSTVMSGFIYPVTSHWIWGGGFLSTAYKNPLFGVGVIDFAGSGVVHMTGGIAALIAAIIIEPRHGRYAGMNGRIADARPGHSTTFSVLGVFILWIGWFGFNAGSTLGLSKGSTETAGRVVVTTTLAAAAGALAGMLYPLCKSKGGSYMVEATMNGVLAGLVAITASCSVVTPWASIIIGFVGGLVYHAWLTFLLYARIDDVVDASAVHGAAGVWGVLAVGLFARPKFVESVYSITAGGVFYGANGNLLAAQCILVLVICVWTGTIIIFLFLLLKLSGLLRVSLDAELKGLDKFHHSVKNNTTSSPDDVLTSPVSECSSVASSVADLVEEVSQIPMVIGDIGKGEHATGVNLSEERI